MCDVPVPSRDGDNDDEQLKADAAAGGRAVTELPKVNPALISVETMTSSSVGIGGQVSVTTTTTTTTTNFNESSSSTLESFNLSDLSDDDEDGRLDIEDMDLLSEILSEDDSEGDVVSQIFKEVEKKGAQGAKPAAAAAAACAAPAPSVNVLVAPQPLPSQPTGFPSEPPKLDSDEVDFLRSLFGMCATGAPPASAAALATPDATPSFTSAAAAPAKHTVTILANTARAAKASNPKLTQPQTDTVNTQAEYRRTVNGATGAHYGNAKYRSKYRRTNSARAA